MFVEKLTIDEVADYLQMKCQAEGKEGFNPEMLRAKTYSDGVEKYQKWTAKGVSFMAQDFDAEFCGETDETFLGFMTTRFGKPYMQAYNAQTVKFGSQLLSRDSDEPDVFLEQSLANYKEMVRESRLEEINGFEM